MTDRERTLRVWYPIGTLACLYQFNTNTKPADLQAI
jgi:hypothetical protein